MEGGEVGIPGRRREGVGGLSGGMGGQKKDRGSGKGRGVNRRGRIDLCVDREGGQMIIKLRRK